MPRIVPVIGDPSGPFASNNACSVTSIRRSFDNLCIRYADFASDRGGRATSHSLEPQYLRSENMLMCFFNLNCHTMTGNAATATQIEMLSWIDLQIPYDDCR